MRKEKVILLSILTTIPFLAYSQNLKYTYDNSGNRINREIIITTKNYSEEYESQLKSDMFPEKKIKIHPNPTNGLLKVEISYWDDKDLCTYKIFNMQGGEIISTLVKSNITELDLQSQPNGLYILYVSLNGKNNSYKIIKK